MPPLPPTYDDLRARVATLQHALPRPPVIAICGHGGAGKSTLARRLAAEFGVRPGQLVGLDGLMARGAGAGAALWELHDWPALTDVLTRVRARPTPARLTLLKRTYEGHERYVDEPMPAVLIVEGIRLLRPETLPLFDLAVWLDLDAGTAGARAVARNVAQGDGQAELDLWRTKWVPEGLAYEREVGPRELADLVLPAPGAGLGES